jgi:hypothetical protein
MIRSIVALSSAALLLSSAAGQAQVAQPQAAVPPPAAAAPLVVGQPAASVLRAGTPIALKMSEGITTEGKKLRVGHRFQLEVADPVTVNGQVVIPAGSPATGEVTDVRNKGMWGKSGGINARLLFVRANGRQIRLTGQLDDKGVTGTAGVVGAIAVVPLAGFFITGTSARIPVGAPVNGFIDEDLPVAFVGAAPEQPMVVTASPAAQPKQ